MNTLKLKNLRKTYGSHVAVEGIELDMAEGELVALLGPSGCGKTTTLRMVAGFIEPTSGEIHIAGKDITAQAPYARGTGMVFQSYALFPHMTVAQNVGFGLEMRKVGRSEREDRVRETLRLVRLEHLQDRLPRQLSGGQQQRVALARALAVNPSVFLLDEPMSNLDAKLRADVREEIRTLQQRLGFTTLLVTHDQEEALSMADRLVVMEAGRVHQIGTAEDLYERPANAFVADFLGRCNIVKGMVEADGVRTPSGALLSANTGQEPGGHERLFVLRPQHIQLRPASAGTAPARVASIQYLGSQTEYRLDFQGTSLLAIHPTPGIDDSRRGIRVGDVVAASWDSAAVRLMAVA
ncbi:MULTISPECIES: ABC transporter ATP-binding protein [unclassified Achromobacter]|uniref:ABC transporter ATP-binding protein n=1 Tax=unclassified Achromobacter TaxID=2626865 RepID=UPI000B51D049|nr:MULTISPECIES: ABC transporter ATP-binding protein [unclassified Achromobacter]OWT77350.1 Fe3+/spermidine/putrescine ABC transporter ATP-binding protein [Achromobacter sp. HZ28]OWT78231.1 Fe3+/spermidine/putrescine ABC transporter ATP-binding protein [Achromobacter sp. HZ34]